MDYDPLHFEQIGAKDNIKMDIKYIKCVGVWWLQLAQDMTCCHVVNIVIKLRVPRKEII